MNQNKTEIVVILDRSGSMASLKQDMEGGFATFLADQKKLPGECLLTLVQFDSAGQIGLNSSIIETVHDARPIAEVSAVEIVPRGGTPLLDAVGITITKVGERLKTTAESDRPGKVLIVIITDGAENSSQEWTAQRVQEAIKHQEEVYQWGFLYLGANVNAFQQGGMLGISVANAVSYTPNSSKGAMKSLSNQVSNYRSSRSQVEAKAALNVTDADRNSLNADWRDQQKS